MKKKQILGISGSTKSQSTSLSILSHIAETFEDVFDLEIFNQVGTLPHFNPDLDQNDLPPAIKAFREKIEKADALLFCTPEYVFSLPGSLKNAIEWNVSTTLFSGKPVAIIVAAASGKKAFESLDLILTTIESVLPGESKLLIQGAKCKLDAAGKIHDENTREKVNSLVLSLLNSIDEDNNQPTKYRS